MATKNYMINDKWLELDKQNIIELQSVDGVLDSLKVNGSEIETPSGKITITENGTDIDIAQYALADVNVEGGGGSSDLTTAQITVTDEYEVEIKVAVAIDDDGNKLSASTIAGSGVYDVILYGGVCYASIPTAEAEGYTVSVSGDLELLEYDDIIITGDGAITIS